MADGNAVAVLREQTAEAAALIANMKDVLGDDDAVALAIESETDLNAAITAGLTRIFEVELMAAGLDNIIKRLRDRKERFEQQGQNLRTAIVTAMDVANIQRFEHALATVSLRKTPAQALVTDEAVLPTRFFKPQPPKLDKRELLAALKAGEQIRGAQLSNGGVTLSIR